MLLLGYGYKRLTVMLNTVNEEDLDSMSLGDLFDLSDEIGDKYLTDEEIAQRDRELAEAFKLIDEAI
jgi:hypothetical protein